jgi:hypothetical protein
VPAGALLARLRGLSRQPVIVACVGGVIVLVSGAVLVARADSRPAATSTRVVYVPTPSPSLVPVPGPTRTVVRTRTVVVTAVPSPAASGRPAAVQLRCSSAQLSLTVRSDKTTYTQDEPVRLTATLRRSDPPNSEYEHFDPRPCFVDPGGFTVYLTDDSHQPVYPGGGCCMGLYAEYFPYTGAQFALARGGTHRVTYTWNGQMLYGGSAGSGPAYVGNYHAVAQWMYPYADSEQITFYRDGPPAP